MPVGQQSQSPKPQGLAHFACLSTNCDELWRARNASSWTGYGFARAEGRYAKAIRPRTAGGAWKRRMIVSERCKQPQRRLRLESICLQKAGRRDAAVTRNARCSLSLEAVNGWVAAGSICWLACSSGECDDWPARVRRERSQIKVKKKSVSTMHRMGGNGVVRWE